MFPFTRRVADRIENIMNEQDEKGIEKYGQPLDPMDNYDWLYMAEEELADALKYFNAEREKRDNVHSDILIEMKYLKEQLIEGNYLEANAAANSVINRLQFLIKKR
jgi:hypothetical protein